MPGHDVSKSVCAHHLPREVAADTEAAEIGLQTELLRWAHLMAKTVSDKWIDPFKISGAVKGHRLCQLNLHRSRHGNVLAGPETWL